MAESNLSNARSGKLTCGSPGLDEAQTGGDGRIQADFSVPDPGLVRVGDQAGIGQQNRCTRRSGAEVGYADREATMFQRDGVRYEFHHLGLPTNEAHANERYSARFKMYTSDSDCGLARVQWHRFAEDSPLHPLIRSTAHPAFKVDDLDRAVLGCKLLLAPYEPIPGYRVAIIEDGGIPVELVQTTLTDNEIWGRAKTGA